LPPKKWDGITVHHKEALKKRLRNKAKEEAWYIVYEILFPSVKRPSSPCKIVRFIGSFSTDTE
jgi:hypothetical protein